jgi:antitoxin component YwqK of YwqJK toxin-antitoxin module
MHWLLKNKVAMLALAGTATALVAVMISQVVVSVRNPHLHHDGLTLKKGERLFSGWVYDIYRSPLSIKQLTYYSQGKKNGVERSYYGNRTLASLKNFKDGLLDGQSLAWHTNGNPKFVKNYATGVVEGDYFVWHPNGQLSNFGRYNNGQEITYKSWTSFGKPFYNYVIRDNEKVGLKGGAFCKRPKELL